MAVQQKECYRVVTIGYLKNFIGTLIQDSSNGSVKYVNLNALSAEKRRDDYCPTYSELTSNSLVQTWNPGSTPNGDRDGIVVSSSAILGGNYASNQLVDQKDLSLKYTRFSGLTISLGKTSFSACGDSTSVSYSHKYVRSTKEMGNCPASRPITYTTSTADTSDTACGEITWHDSPGSVTNCNTYTIGQNGTAFSAASRSLSVQATVVFRGTTLSSNTVSMTQLERGGGYDVPVSTRTTYTGITAYGGDPTNVGCDGGTCYATATAYYDLYETRKWKDICGNVFNDKTKEFFVRSGSTYVGQDSHTFSKVNCPTETYSTYYDIPFSYGGQSTSYRVTQNCSQSCGAPSQNCHVSSSAPKILPNTGGTITYVLKFD
jgi:hypothetical protein